MPARATTADPAVPPLPPLGWSSVEDWPSAPPAQRPGPEPWFDPVTDLPGVGRTTADRARAIGITTIGDLLEHLPARYEDFDAGARPVAALTAGDEATVRVRLDDIAVQRTRRRNLRLVRARVHDDSGRMVAVWFNQEHLARILHPGDEPCCAGALRRGAAGDGRALARGAGRAGVGGRPHAGVGAGLPGHRAAPAPPHPRAGRPGAAARPGGA